MGMTEDDKRNCCLVEIQETEAKYYKTLEDIEKVSVTTCVCTYIGDCWYMCIFVLAHGNVVLAFPFVTSSLLVSRACGPGHSMEMSAIGRFIGGAQMSQELIDRVIIGSAIHRRRRSLGL